MAKTRAAYPSISALQALILLYSQKREIPKREDVSESKYVEALSAALKNDNIITGTSKNLIYKLIGNPPQSKPDLTDAIDPQKLDALSELVFNEYGLSEKLDNHPEVKYYWSTFKDYFFPMPSHFSTLQERCYYKFLNDEEKKSIDGYVQRKINEHNLDAENTMTYNVHVWSYPDRDVRAPILQINMSKGFATYTVFSKTIDGKEKKLTTKSVMRTDLPGGFFRITNNTLFIFLADENTSNAVRASFYFSILDLNFNNLKHMKGILSFSAFNISTPTAAKVILEKQKNYKDAYERARTLDGINPRIVFDLINQRMEVTDGSLESSLDKTISSRNYSAMIDAKGAYILGYVTVTNDFGKLGKLTIGNCFIRPNGMVSLKFPHHLKRLAGYVSNNIFHGHDTIVIKHFIEDGLDQFKFTYDLNIFRNSTDGHVALLKGFFSGFLNNTPAAGEIVFIKLEDVDDETLLTSEFEGVIWPDKPEDHKFGKLICDQLFKKEKDNKQNTEGNKETIAESTNP